MGASMNTPVFVAFSRDELWLLRSVIRHEQQGIETWKFPPASRDLNARIAEALLFCEDQREPQAMLELSLGDTFAIDYCVPQEAKDVNSVPLGKNILLKAFRARAEIEAGPLAMADEPEDAPSVAEVAALLAAREEREVWPWQRRQRPQR